MINDKKWKWQARVGREVLPMDIVVQGKIGKRKQVALDGKNIADGELGKKGRWMELTGDVCPTKLKAGPQPGQSS